MAPESERDKQAKRKQRNARYYMKRRERERLTKELEKRTNSATRAEKNANSSVRYVQRKRAGTSIDHDENDTLDEEYERVRQDLRNDVCDVAKEVVFKDFEDRIEDLHHGHCWICQKVTLSMSKQQMEQHVCADCQGLDKLEYLRKKLLPVWYDDDGIHCELPHCLVDLTDAEKLLIARASPFVPLHHIWKGVLGMKGHVCTYPQHIEEVCSVLPRTPAKVAMIHFEKLVEKEIGAPLKRECYKVRRQSVLDALMWLKDHNVYYEDIVIDEDNLSWMKGDEVAFFPARVVNRETGDNAVMESSENCSPVHRTPAGGKNADMPSFGLVSEDAPPIPGCSDKTIGQIIEDSVNDHTASTGEFVQLQWPCIGREPISEFDSTKKVFAWSFPWLFPGGVGDPSDVEDPRISMEEWGKKLMYYYDGRFARDRIFPFYALNYISRRRNQNNSNYFMKDFDVSCPRTLDELKDRIVAGDTRFLDKVIYYSNRIRGSYSYWKTQREQLYSWINEMVSLGKGGPNFFITLTCAEHYWPDIFRLVKERLELSGVSEVVDMERDIHKYTNELSIVVQEYFQKRVEIFMETVGRDLLKIEHYYLRYEFTTGRGQIHCHMLAIAPGWKIWEKLHLFRDDKEKQAEILGEWASRNLEMSACSMQGILDLELSEGRPHPCSYYYRNVKDPRTDIEMLKLCVMKHECNNYCLTKVDTSTGCRICRMGAGPEEEKGTGNTPGFPLQEKASIEDRQQYGYNKLYLKRNHSRIVQMSELLVQVWRGNADIQLILYESSPTHPDLTEIARVTDYVVSYCCKGHTTHYEERNQMKDLVFCTENIFDDSQDVRRVVTKMMNRACANRIISKAECMVLMCGLALWKCSERFETISLSNCVRITESGAFGDQKGFWGDYVTRRRDLEYLSGHQFFHFTRNGDGRKRKMKNHRHIVPHYTGASIKPVFPLTHYFCRNMLFLHKPWRDASLINTDPDPIRTYNHMLKQDWCSSYVKINHDRELQRFVKKMDGYESKAKENNLEADVPEDVAATMEMVGCSGKMVVEEEDQFDSMPFGADHDFSVLAGEYSDDMLSDVETWIFDRREEDRTNRLAEQLALNLPLKSNGELYTIDQCESDQAAAVGKVLTHLFAWLRNPDETPTLRLTLTGDAGSGKSTVVNTLVTYLRRMFGYDDVVHVYGPTGGAACNAGGETMHYGLSLPVKKRGKHQVEEISISEERQASLLKRLAEALVLVFDESSMMECRNVGIAEAVVRKLAHRGFHEQKAWGGIPVVIFVGDYFQLPAIHFGVTDIPTMVGTDTDRKWKGRYTEVGIAEFRKFTKNVSWLSAGKRQKKGELWFLSLLERARFDRLTERDVRYLKRFSLEQVQHELTKEEMDDLLMNATYLYAKREPLQKKNMEMLRMVSSEENPVARIQAKSEGVNNGKAIHSHFDEKNCPSVAMLCRGCRVALTGRNIYPHWGLYNNASGVVRDIVYEKGKSPNKGDLPRCVLVEFASYTGPAWDAQNPKVSICVDHNITHNILVLTFAHRFQLVPIPCMTVRCDGNKSGQKRCCSKTFVPLVVAFARTIHSFQGQSAGPVDGDRPPNAVNVIIVDPGDKGFESRNPGTFYVALSRATTMGCGDIRRSAIYFQGGSINSHHLCNMTKTVAPLTRPWESRTNLKVQRRDHYIGMLEEARDAMLLDHDTVRKMKDDIESFTATSSWSRLHVKRIIEGRRHVTDTD